MKLSFDYYKNLESVDFYLCNPDGKELFPVVATNRNLTLRFNDLSELTFDVGDKLVSSDGTVLYNEAYDYIQTKRLIYATNIGWFQIANVTENNDGIATLKSVRCESLQAVFKNRGFISEERVYCFYNPNDPYDDEYDSSDVGAIPSVLGQLHKQLGIEQDLSQGMSEPDVPYDQWTVTYIGSTLVYGQDKALCRTFKEEATYGYDWMVNSAEEAFGVVFLFDFLNKTIHIKTPEEITERANVVYTFSNFMNSINIEENADEIVTVLSCKGTDCDISLVNPTGTTYICDFSYYMDKVTRKWMSDALISKLEEWQARVDDSKADYIKLVADLRDKNFDRQQYESELSLISLSLQDLKNARDKYISSSSAGSKLTGVVTAENVDVGKCSLDAASRYNKQSFQHEETITGYKNQPTYNTSTKTWSFSGDSANDTPTNNYNNGYKYFSDNSDGKSYCHLRGKAVVNAGEQAASYVCSGFTRYIAYDDLLSWISVREQQVNEVNTQIDTLTNDINGVLSDLNDISSELNILKFFSQYPALLKELNCYWIEGEYVDEHIAVLEDTTPAEEIDLCNELLENGQIELSKISQPRFSFTIESADATKSQEFVEQMSELELGKIITIEPKENVWYYPALLEISINLDIADIFELAFANALRLDDWGYTYADLISDAASTSRQISSNWHNLVMYHKDKGTISDFIKRPLDATMRAGFANGVNQDFVVDSTGILGRKRVSENSDDFEAAQIRILNNLILFTDDNWSSVKTALGKIVYEDETGKPTNAYGLIADTIIGSLMLGERLVIKNTDSSISIDKDGITIKHIADDGTKTSVFEATPSGSLIINTLKKDANGEGYRYSLLNDGFSISSITKIDGQVKETPVLKVDNTGLSINGEVNATSGTIGGCKIDADGKLIVNLAYVTGTLSAEHINASSISVDVANVNGLLVDGKIDASLLQVGGFTIDGERLIAQGLRDDWVEGDDIVYTLTTTLSPSTISMYDADTGHQTSISAGYLSTTYATIGPLTFTPKGIRGLDSSLITTTKGGFSELNALLQYLLDNIGGGGNTGDNTGDNTGGDSDSGNDNEDTETWVCEGCGTEHTVKEVYETSLSDHMCKNENCSHYEADSHKVYQCPSCYAVICNGCNTIVRHDT